MIRYTLACDKGHTFDSWFADSAAYEDLVQRQMVQCTTCESRAVAKTIMAPAVIATAGASATRSGAESVADAPAASIVPEAERSDARVLRDLLRAFRSKVLAETIDVGARFPEQARLMHDGELPHREIRGQASLDEARALLEDGIAILPLPPAPDDLN